jgi:hypothetical protein
MLDQHETRQSERHRLGVELPAENEGRVELAESALRTRLELDRKDTPQSGEEPWPSMEGTGGEHTDSRRTGTGRSARGGTRRREFGGLMQSDSARSVVL